MLSVYCFIQASFLLTMGTSSILVLQLNEFFIYEHCCFVLVFSWAGCYFCIQSYLRGFCLPQSRDIKENHKSEIYWREIIDIGTSQSKDEHHFFRASDSYFCQLLYCRKHQWCYDSEKKDGLCSHDLCLERESHQILRWQRSMSSVVV